jgi:hypothetical protein
MRVFILSMLVGCNLGAPGAGSPSGHPQLVRLISADSAELQLGGRVKTIRTGGTIGDWTLMGIVDGATGATRYAVLEDFTRWRGHVLFVDQKGISADLPKSLEPTFPDASLYLGHTFDEVRGSSVDLLANEMLGRPGDPKYEQIVTAFPPIHEMKTDNFVGTHETSDKVGFGYGGISPDFDPAPYDPRISAIRDHGKVWNGLVGGWLPVVRYVYPQDEGNWTEMISFAPLHVANGNQRIQPVWYRVSRIENGRLKWSRYFDSYHPYPPRTHSDATAFYKDMQEMRNGWERALQPAMRIEIPDTRLSDMTRLSLVRDMITRVGDYPKYGVFDKNYGGSEHDGFPDTFNADVTTMVEWGMIDLAGRYIDNYLTQFVRDDGSILYRGPEMGQYGRMLTVIAQYGEHGGDPALLLKDRARIDGITNLLLSFRAKALGLPKTDAAYGMIAGWSEADSCLDPDPSRYMQPYFSNSAEAARGFRDLGRAWQRIGVSTGRPELVSRGRKLVKESDDLKADMEIAITRSMLTRDGEHVLPAIAGVKEPFDVAVRRDPLDPQYRSYRAYMEMLFSGILPATDVKSIIQYRAAHHDTILGVPTAYGYDTGELAGFLSYGHAYGLIQQDMVRESLLMLYSMMAHQYTRGDWTAPETRSIIPGKSIAPYCTPAQVFVALVTRWMLVFEDPTSDALWLAKATPRDWLQSGKNISVRRAPTRWGSVGYSLKSSLDKSTILASVELPHSPFAATIHLRLRVPAGHTLQSVTLNGQLWSQFNAQDEMITIPPGHSGTVSLVVGYK